MKEISNIFIITICIVLTLSCTKPDENGQIINIEDEFNIDMVEQLGEADRSLVFKISTIEEFSCLNYEIDCSSENSPSIFTLYLEEIIEPTDCLEGFSVAKCQSILNELQMGDNPFRVVIKEAVVNQGMIIKTPYSYSIEMETKHGLGTYQNELNIIPDNLIWASVSSNDLIQASTINVLLSDYLSAFENPTMKEGYYGYFTIEDQKLNLKEVPVQNYIYSYYFTLEDEELISKLKDYSNELREQFDAIELDLYTRTGFRF